ncbi:MYPU_1760 family metalloprotease [Metamycoplasma neophronis]|uniref:Uncharacterized protein n=1 Tax=Metamycoplasma neophronis TaxID=872983 RepID=A0ABY2Z612_9BACT|nr:hypothetical protein [Metamycoplasma neophronis]TPR54729.1 hypothetical protein FJR74_00450 [Metamycoplasma neophronis]
MEDNNQNNIFRKPTNRRFPLWAILLIIFGILTLLGGIIIGVVFVFRNAFESFKFVNRPNVDLEAKTTNAKMIYDPEQNQEILNKNFKYGDLSIIEYPYGKADDGTLLYYLGEDGRALLNEMFKKRAVYGPEINNLKSVYINKRFSNQSTWSSVNGLYSPNSASIYLNIDNVVSKLGEQVQSTNLLQRVEYILGVLVHEYTHHIDASYDNPSLTDNYADTSFIDKNRGNIKKAVNKKFIDDFTDALNFKLPNFYLKKDNDGLALASSFYPSNSEKPIFSKYTSYDLFRLANMPLTKEEYDEYLAIEKYNMSFNNSIYNQITFPEKVKLDRIKYSYSIEELFPRELLKMSFTSNPYLYSKKDIFKNYLYFNLPSYDNSVYLSAIGEDILKMSGINTRYRDSFRIYATNWVFDPHLKEFTNIYKKRPFAQIKDNKKLAQLFAAYVDLMGYGQAISYMGYNNWNWGDLTLDTGEDPNINLGGYLTFKNTDLTPDNLFKYKVAMLIGDDEDYTNNYKVELHASDYQFLAKKTWNQPFETMENKSKPWYVENLYPMPKDADYKYVSYFSDSIATSELDTLAKNNRLNINLWIDRNHNNEIDEGEVQGILNQATELNPNDGEKYYKRQQDNKRNVTNYKPVLDKRNKARSIMIDIDKLEDRTNYYFKYSIYK